MQHKAMPIIQFLSQLFMDLTMVLPTSFDKKKSIIIIYEENVLVLWEQIAEECASFAYSSYHIGSFQSFITNLAMVLPTSFDKKKSIIIIYEENVLALWEQIAEKCASFAYSSYHIGSFQSKILILRQNSSFWQHCNLDQPNILLMPPKRSKCNFKRLLQIQLIV